MRKVINLIPELLIISAILFYWKETQLFNPIAISLLALILSKVVFNKTFLNILSGIIFFLLSSYMVLAVLSEYHKFENGSVEKSNLLAIGLGIFISIAFISIIMLIKDILLTKKGQVIKSSNTTL